MVFLVLQLKNCVGCGGLIGNLCFKVEHSAKHLVSSIRHRIHALQQYNTHVSASATIT